MKYTRIIATAMAIAASAVLSPASGQDSFRESFDNFSRGASEKYSSFKRECDEKYVEFLRQSWEKYEAKPEIKSSKEKPLPPVKYEGDGKTPDDNQIQPIASVPMPPSADNLPIPEDMEEVLPSIDDSPFRFSFLGNDLSIRAGAKARFSLKSTSPNSVADCWAVLSGGGYDGVLSDCLSIRSRYRLCDWAYLMMIFAFTDAYTHTDDESMILTAYLYSRSGYNMRLGLSEKGLTMLFSTDCQLLDIPYYSMGGKAYYQLNGKDTRMEIVDYSFPDSKDMSMMTDRQPFLPMDESETRTRSSADRSSSVSCRVNMNLLKFYSLYPTVRYENDHMTQWAIYARMPLDSSLRQQIYPSLKSAIREKSETQAVQILLHFVQTAFKYETDDKVWGRERAFFCEETFYYPYCDCEDRAILFSRLVRDLVGLDVMLVYYPGHLSTAVKFRGSVSGDYFIVKEGRFTVCDPTYINAPIGETMPSVDGTKAEVMVL